MQIVSSTLLMALAFCLSLPAEAASKTAVPPGSRKGITKMKAERTCPDLLEILRMPIEELGLRGDTLQLLQLLQFPKTASDLVALGVERLKTVPGFYLCHLLDIQKRLRALSRDLLQMGDDEQTATIHAISRARENDATRRAAPITAYPFSTQTRNALNRLGMVTLNDITSTTPDALIDREDRSVGPAIVEEIITMLDYVGVRWEFPEGQKVMKALTHRMFGERLLLQPIATLELPEPIRAKLMMRVRPFWGELKTIHDVVSMSPRELMFGPFALTREEFEALYKYLQTPRSVTLEIEPAPSKLNGPYTWTCPLPASWKEAYAE